MDVVGTCNGRRSSCRLFVTYRLRNLVLTMYKYINKYKIRGSCIEKVKLCFVNIVYYFDVGRVLDKVR